MALGKMTLQELCQNEETLVNKGHDFQLNTEECGNKPKHMDLGVYLSSLWVKIPETKQSGMSGSLGIIRLQNILECQRFWLGLQEMLVFSWGGGLISPSILLKLALPFENKRS